MRRIRDNRDPLIAELVQGVQARLDQARERHAPFLQTVEDKHPPDVSGDQWRTAIGGLKVFLLAGHGDEAERLGWPKDELYRVPPLWSRVDLCGAGLLIGDREVVGITATEIRIKTASGSTLAFYRKSAVDYRLVYETRLKLIRGNYADDSAEEPRLRAFEHTVRFCCDQTGFGLDDAKQLVLDAIKRSTTKEPT
jgi:hypothetical protein